MTAFGLPGGRNTRLFYPVAPALAGYNVASFGVTAPVKRGFLIGVTSSDNSATALVIPSLPGWDFSMISMNGDSAATAHLAFWIGRPNPQVIDSPSGTTLTLFNSVANSTYSSGIFRQYDGTFKGQLIAGAFTNPASASSVTIAAPAGPMRAGGFMTLAGAYISSGGAGMNAGTDLNMPDIATSGLTALRIGATPGILYPSTVVTAGRSARWTSTYLVLR